MSKLRFIFNLGFIKEAASSLIPTSFIYIDIFKKFYPEHAAWALAAVTFFILFVILIFVKIREYQRSVSKALAIGYFKNFVEKLVSLYASKGNNKIKFFFENETKEFHPSQTTIRIFLEDSHSELQKKNEEIKKSAQIAYVDKGAFNYPFFVWAKIEGDKLLIYDLPRTLFALKDYIDSTLDSNSELDKETRKFFKTFNAEFRNLWARLDKTGINIELAS